MFDQRTVFVVGAGASKHLGFPLGPELLVIIQDLLNPPEPNPATDVIIGLAAQWIGPESLDWDEAKDLCAAIGTELRVSSFLSIDAYVEANPGKKGAICKSAIAALIGQYEYESALSIDRWSTSDGQAALKDFWATRLFDRICASATPEEIARRVQRITFIAFNYDRCLELIAWRSLQEAIGTYHVAQDVYHQIRIWHPYGSLGSFPEARATGMGLEGGFAQGGFDIFEGLERIRTFSEGALFQPAGSWIDSGLDGAERLITLGFAFSTPENIKAIGAARTVKAILANTYRAGPKETDAAIAVCKTAFPNVITIEPIDELAQDLITGLVL